MNKLSILFVIFVLSIIIACDKSETKEISLHPEACIQLSDTVVRVGENVEFISCTKNATNIFWDLSREDTIELEQFTYSFNTPGTKDITLVAENESGGRSLEYAKINVTGEEGKVYGDPELENNYFPQDIVAVSDNGFLVTYWLWPSIGSEEEHQLRIVALDANIEYQNAYVLQLGGANLLYSSILNLSNGKIGINWSDYISGYSGGRSAILETDLSNPEINTLEPAGVELGFKGLIEKDQTLYNFGFEGERYDYNIFIRKTELDGTFIETKTISKTDTSLIPFKMIATNDDGFAIAGLMSKTIGSAGVNKERVFIFKTDADFNILWEAYFGVEDQYELIHGLLQTSTGLLISYGYNDKLYFQNISTEGADIVEKTLEVELAFQGGGDMIDYGNGYLIATDNKLLKTDYEFNIVSKKFLNSKSRAIKIIQRTDGGFAILMDQRIKNTEFNTSPSNVYIVKLDEDGEIEYLHD